jgi:hypothetical protein
MNEKPQDVLKDIQRHVENIRRNLEEERAWFAKLDRTMGWLQAVSWVALALGAVLILAIIISGRASAATVERAPFHPGAAPCAGRCSIADAAEAYGVPLGRPLPTIIPKNSTVRGMAWYADGRAVYSPDARFRIPHAMSAECYHVSGDDYLCVIIACGNPALLTFSRPALGDPLAPAHGLRPWSVPVGVPFFGGGGKPWDGPWTPPAVPPVVTPPPDAVIPLPPALPLLAAALAVLWRLRR